MTAKSKVSGNVYRARPARRYREYTVVSTTMDVCTLPANGSRFSRFRHHQSALQCQSKNQTTLTSSFPEPAALPTSF